jgi:Zn-dependent peptidase ImmA (M78 family)/DNA-binding XRE family transcriptional regulator
MDNAMARARIEVGYSQDDVAAALGVSRAMVSYWESAKRSPNDRQRAALARLYRVSMAQLEGREPLPIRGDEARMLFRGAENELSGQAKRGVREFSEFLDNYAHLAGLANVPIRGMTQSPFVSTSAYETADDARRKAEEVRAHLRLGLGAISDIDAVAELLGVTVFRAALGADLTQALSGAFFAHPHVGFSILVNLQMTPGRRRFTLAHELAHALFHSDRDRFVLSLPRGGPRERFADTFAGEFLMPTEGIRRVLEDGGVGPRVTDPAEVVLLQRIFNVSFGMTLVRLQRAKLISQHDFAEFQRVRPVVLAQSLGYDIGDEEFVQHPEYWRIRRFPRRFIGLVRDTVIRGIISPASAANLMWLSIDDIEELIRERQTGQPDPGVTQEINDYRDSGVLADA